MGIGAVPRIQVEEKPKRKRPAEKAEKGEKGKGRWIRAKDKEPEEAKEDTHDGGQGAAPQDPSSAVSPEGVKEEVRIQDQDVEMTSPAETPQPPSASQTPVAPSPSVVTTSVAAPSPAAPSPTTPAAATPETSQAPEAETVKSENPLGIISQPDNTTSSQPAPSAPSNRITCRNTRTPASDNGAIQHGATGGNTAQAWSGTSRGRKEAGGMADPEIQR